MFGAGPLGLHTALALACNGAAVEIAAQSPISDGPGFVHPAGLLQPLMSNDPRADGWFQTVTDFCAGACEDPAWGMTPIRALLMSNRDSPTRRAWMRKVPTWPASVSDLEGRRAYGVWLDTYTLRPDRAIVAIERELRALSIPFARRGSAKMLMKIPSVRQAANQAMRNGAEAFVLALGLGLAALSDIEGIGNANAGLSAGVGVTIQMPQNGLRLDHMIVDADDFGYLVPQQGEILGGGVNIPMPFDDELVAGKGESVSVEHAKWEDEVRGKLIDLRPELADCGRGIVRVGACPIRHEVLTIGTDDFSIPGALIGGAGPCGWTFGPGVANDTCAFLCERLGTGRPPRPLAFG